MIRRLNFAIAACWLLTPFVSLASSLELGSPFCDNAVLQREMDLPVWGWSKPGSTMTVEFAGQQATTTAGAGGKWMLKLKPLKASAEPAEMIVSDSEGQKVSIRNILVGEVWMASGQSNMQWIAAKCDVQKIVADLKAKDETPPIREFGVTGACSALHPIESAVGAWKIDDYGNYSAVAFAFAHKLYGELKVLIGILNRSWSETAIESWNETTRRISCIESDSSSRHRPDGPALHELRADDRLAAVFPTARHMIYPLHHPGHHAPGVNMDVRHHRLKPLERGIIVPADQ
jgi:hypothetical protein